MIWRRVSRNAPLLTPEPLTAPIIASLFRRFAESVPYLTEEYVPRAKVQEMANELAGRLAEQKAKQPYEDVYRSLHARVAEFEEALGERWITGRTWEKAEELGAAFRLLVDNKLTETLDARLGHEIRLLERAAAALTETRAAVAKVGAIAPPKGVEK